jgi:hypothetical protein
MNFFTGLPLGGSSVNPLTEDIIPDTDNVYDVGTSTKRLKTGYYTRLNVTDVGVQNTSLAYTGTLLPGSSFAADQSAGFAFTLDREITITRIMIDRNMNPTLPTPRGVRIWQEPGTLLFSGTVDNTVSDANYWYAEVNWVLNANVPLRYATDIPAFAEINYAPIAFTFSPFFTLVNPSVVALSLGVYPANQGLFPFPPIGNFLFRDGPAPITVNGIPVALLTDLADVTALEAKTQNITATPGNTVFAGTTTGLNHVNLSNIGTKSHTQIDNDINDLKTATQNITGNPGVTTFTGTTVGLNHADLSNIGTNTHTQLDSHVANASIHFTQAAIDHVNILNKGTNTHAQIDTNLTTLNGKTVNLQGFTAPQPYNEFQGGIKMFGSIGYLEHGNLNAIDMTLIENIYFGRPFGTHWMLVNSVGGFTNLELGRTANASNTHLTFNSNTGNVYQIRNLAGVFSIDRNSTPWITYSPSTTNILTPGVRGLYIGPGARPVSSSGFTQTQDVTLTNSTVETIITGTGIGTLTIPANSIIVGSTSAIRGGGIIDSEGKGTETVTLRLKFNGTTVSTFVVTLAANLDAGSAWTLNSLAVYKAGGLRVITSVAFGNTTGQNDIRNNTTIFAINPAIANTLSITAQWNAANAANTITLASLVTTNLFQPQA